MVRDPVTGVRKVAEVVELSSDEKALVFTGADAAPDQESGKLEVRARAHGYSAARSSDELRRREDFISNAVGRGLTSYSSLVGELRRFYGSSSLTL